MESLFVFVFSFFLSSQLGKHFFLPFSYLSGIRIDYLAPTLYLTDILSIPFIAYLLGQSFKRLTFITMFIKKNILVVASVVFLCVVNYHFSLSKPLWIYNVVRIVQWVAIFYFFKQRSKNKSVFSAVLLGVLCGGFLQLILSLLQLGARHSMQGLWYYLGERSFSIFTPGIAKAYFFGHEFLRPYGSFSHPNSLAGFYLLLYAFILTQKRVTNIFIKTTLLILFSCLVLVTFSRTAIVVYVLINIFYLFRNSLTCRICTIAKVFVAGVLILFALNISGDINSMQKRDDFTQKAISIIASKPFSGVGVGSYLIAQHSYPQKFSTFFEQPVHNIFLLSVAQLGIPLSILLFTMIIPTSPFWLQGTSRLIIPIRKHYSLLLPLLVVILTGSMDHYWLTLQQNVLVSAVVFGILSVYDTKTKTSRNR
jgi:hypothetical protein